MQAEPLLALAVTVASKHSLPNVLTTMVEGLAAQPGVALARIWLLQPVDRCGGCVAPAACRGHAHCLHLVASAGTPLKSTGEDWSGLNGSFRRIPLQAWKVGVIGATGDSILIPDMVPTNEWIARPEWVAREGIRSLAGHPLAFQGTGLGVLAIFSREPLDDASFAWLRVFAGQAAVAITNARVFEDRQRAEAEYRRSEAYSREAQRLSHTGSFGWRIATGELVWSEETFSILGVPPGTKPTLALVLDRVHPEDRPIVQRMIDRASHDETDVDYEHRLLMPDGSVKHLRVRARAVRGGSGDPEWVGAVSDITAVKQAEDKIRQDERELRQIVEAIPELIQVLTPDGEPFHANARMLEYTGLALADMQAGGFRERVFHPDDVARLRAERWRALTRGLPFELEQRVRRKDGEYRWFLTRLNPLRDEQGRILRWYAVGTDIDDRKRAEERIRRENLALREEIGKTAMFEEIVGTSAPLRAVLSRVGRVAPTDSTVLITGETGTGKELIARAIHKYSKRAAGIFVSVNCAAIPPALVASELFGHEKGAFTGALSRRAGRFELAAGGTLFLDEVGELPPETQIALLHVLQDRTFERVGGGRPIHADVRVVAATNRSLEDAVVAGAFRADLFYRLNVVPVSVPPLRDRREDIPLLVQYFVDRYARETGKRIKQVSKKTLALLQSYAWPGNIRELQNVVERSVILADTDTLTLDDRWLLAQSAVAAPAKQPLAAHRYAQEKATIEAALAETQGRVAGASGAAAKLQMPPSTLESKIRSLGINKHRFRRVYAA
jgi:PAS domain S-box-containing protein